MKNKKVLILVVMLLVCLACLTGCSGKQRFVIGVDKNGAAELDSSTVYYTREALLEWATPNRKLTQADVPDWVNVWAPAAGLTLNDSEIFLQTQFNADILVYDRMLSQSSTSSVYEIGIFSGNYDVTNVEKWLSGIDCEMTVYSEGAFGLESITLGSLKFKPGSSYVTYKGNSTWVIDVDALARDNWSSVVSMARADGIPSILMNFSTSVTTDTSGTYRQFTDVPTKAWYSKAVNTLAWNGFINGIGNNRFSPDGNLTVAQVCKLLAGIVVPDIDTTNPTSYWAYPYIKYCVDHYWVEDRGVINAKNYDVPIRRAEAFHAAALAFGVDTTSDILFKIYYDNDDMEYATYRELADKVVSSGASGMVGPGEFTRRNLLPGRSFEVTGRSCDDVPESAMIKGSVDMSDYYQSFGQMYQGGFVNGDGKGNYNTTGYLTRAEFCQIVYNMMYYDFSVANPHHMSSANDGLRIDAAYDMYRGRFNPRELSGVYEYYGF